MNNLGSIDRGHPALDPSGWKSYTEDGTMRVEILVTDRAHKAMSDRQREDLKRGSELIARAFEPDESAAYFDGIGDVDIVTGLRLESDEP